MFYFFIQKFKSQSAKFKLRSLGKAKKKDRGHFSGQASFRKIGNLGRLNFFFGSIFFAADENFVASCATSRRRHHNLSLSLSLSLTHTHTHSHTHTHVRERCTHKRAHPFALFVSFCLLPSLSLSHTHTHAFSLTNSPFSSSQSHFSCEKFWFSCF